MSDPLRRQIIQAQLELIGARLDAVRAEQGIKRAYVAYGRVSMPTVLKVLRDKKNHKVSTLLEIADALDCDVEITITRRTTVMSSEQCAVCGETARLVREWEEIRIGNRSAIVPTEKFRCDNCGESYVTPQQMDAAIKSASDEIRSQED